MAGELTPRARAILVAVEREVSARLDEIERDEPDAVPVASRRTARPAPLRAVPELLTALELGVAGLSREEVAERLGVGEDLLDAVFGDGSAPGARLARAA